MRPTTYLLIPLLSLLSMLQLVTANIGYVTWISSSDNRDGTWTYHVTITDYDSQRKYFARSAEAKRLIDGGLVDLDWVSFDIAAGRHGQENSQTAVNIRVLQAPPQ